MSSLRIIQYKCCQWKRRKIDRISVVNILYSLNSTKGQGYWYKAPDQGKLYILSNMMLK